MSVARQPAIWHRLGIQWRVIRALVLRETLTRYGRDNFGFAWLFLEPALFTLGVAAIWSAMQVTHGSSISIAAFALTGYSVLLAWRNVANRCIGAIEPNKALLYHANVTCLDVVLARALLEVCGATGSFLLLAAAFVAAGEAPPPEDIPFLVFAWTLLCWFSVALGLVIGACSELSPLVDRAWHVAVYLLFPASGAVFLVEWLPERLQSTLGLLPTVQLTEMVRDGYFGSRFASHYALPYVVGVNLALSCAGLAFTRRVAARVELG